MKKLIIIFIFCSNIPLLYGAKKTVEKKPTQIITTPGTIIYTKKLASSHSISAIYDPIKKIYLAMNIYQKNVLAHPCIEPENQFKQLQSEYSTI